MSFILILVLAICIAALESNGVVPLQNLLTTLGGWPLEGNGFNNLTYTWHDSLFEIAGHLGLNVLLSINVSPDPNNTAKYVVVVSSFSNQQLAFKSFY